MIPDFLRQDSVAVAPLLLGWKLICETDQGIASGYIVETEAYDMADAASHSYRGETPRTAPMFDVAGTIYVYFTYGMHYCVNIVTGSIGQGQAVLIRALQPVEGLELMRQRRRVTDDRQLTNGPAKMTQALGITRHLTGTGLGAGSLHLEPGIQPAAITQTTRIGITKAIDQPWRFYITDNPYVSRR